jgi:hypothetical protein
MEQSSRLISVISLFGDVHLKGTVYSLIMAI